MLHFSKTFFRELFTSLLPAKVFTFTHVISINDGCRESSSTKQNRVICRSKCKAFRKEYYTLTHELEYNIQPYTIYSHIQPTLVLKVGVGQPDQASLTWRMHILILESLRKHEHIWRNEICSNLIKVLRKCWKLVPASLNLANCEPTAVVALKLTI